MAESALKKFLGRLESGSQVTSDDRRRLQQFVSNLNSLEEERLEVPPPPPDKAPKTMQDFLDRGYHNEDGTQEPIPRFNKGSIGLFRNGWNDKPFEVGGELGKGSCGSARLVFRRVDMQKPPEQRRLAALKVQKPKFQVEDNWLPLWIEVTAMRALVHPHIISIYSHFLVIPDPDPTEAQLEAASASYGSPGPVIMKPRETMWILMEYATGGTLYQEILRYCRGEVKISEHGARYYMLQILDGEYKSLPVLFHLTNHSFFFHAHSHSF